MVLTPWLLRYVARPPAGILPSNGVGGGGDGTAGDGGSGDRGDMSDGSVTWPAGVWGGCESWSATEAGATGVARSGDVMPVTATCAAESGDAMLDAIAASATVAAGLATALLSVSWSDDAAHDSPWLLDGGGEAPGLSASSSACVRAYDEARAATAAEISARDKASLGGRMVSAVAMIGSTLS